MGAQSAHALGGADSGTERFSIQIAGIPVGRLDIAGRENGQSYSAAIKLRTTGVADAFASFRYEAQSNGAMRNGAYKPKHFAESGDTGRKNVDTTISYSRGIPKPNGPSKPHAVNPRKQGDTVDPLTAVYGIFKDQTAQSICTQDFKVYNGETRVRMQLSKGAANGNTVTCNGTYTRLGGFEADDMARGRVFSFSNTYTKTGDVFRMDAMIINSLRGRVKILRR